MVVSRLKDVFAYQGNVLKMKTLIKDRMIFFKVIGQLKVFSLLLGE